MEEIKKESARDHGFIYTLPFRDSAKYEGGKDWDVQVYVRNRPKSFEIGAKTYHEADQADAYLSVTDTFTVAPTGKNFVWMPWNEGRHPTPELYYACNRTLIWWSHYMKLPTIQVFCDGGSHRSVSIFGAFLRTYFTKSQAADIVAKRVPKFDDYEIKDRSTWCDPLEYIDSYLETFPSDRLLFKAMGKDYLSRLDTYCDDVWKQVKERYADNKGGDL